MLLFFVCAAPVPCIFPDCLGLTKIALLCCTGWPNTNSLCVAGSQKYRLNNCQVLSWAHELIGNIHGLICVCGDMNASLNSFDMCRHIIAEGWQDMALASHRRFGCDLLPTCKSATRHTYGIGNPELCQFLRDAWVDFEHDMDASAVQLFSLEVPNFNQKVWKWIQPSSLDDCTTNALDFHSEADRAAHDIDCSVRQHLEANNMDEALKVWSERCEKLVLKHTLTTEGEVLPWAQVSWEGAPRGTGFEGFGPPRFKQGRNRDFCVDSASNPLEVRQAQKQARRLQALIRTLSYSLFGPIQRSKCEELWAAIMRSSGFRPDFPRWAWNELGLDIVHHLDGDSLSLLVDEVYEYANKLASARWRAKKTEFAVQPENSWKDHKEDGCPLLC